MEHIDYSKLTGKGIKIVIVDSGINTSHPAMKDYSFTGAELVESDGVLAWSPSFNDRIGHGTAVAYIIKKQCPDALVHMIKIFDDDYETTEARLLSALEFIHDRLCPDIIHLSTGVTICDELIRLKELCEKITAGGTIIISAFDNTGAVSYPAAFDCVLGVDWYGECIRIDEYICVDDSMLNVLGYGMKQKLPWIADSFNIVGGASFSAPIITAKVAAIMEAGIRDISGIKKQLSSGAKDNRTVHKAQDIVYPFQIYNAIAFPFNKEIQVLARREDLLSFKVHSFYDYRVSRFIGKSIGQLLKCDNEKRVLDYTKIDWAAPFDTVILGHLKEISKAVSIDLIREMLEKCLEWKKTCLCL